jgi:hypothetical protein
VLAHNRMSVILAADEEAEIEALLSLRRPTPDDTPDDTADDMLRAQIACWAGEGEARCARSWCPSLCRWMV